MKISQNYQGAAGTLTVRILMKRTVRSRKAIGDGILSEERFHSFYRDKKEAEYVSVQKNKTKAIDYVKQRKLFRKP